MIWFLLALVIALPVLLGLIPGMDAAGARRLVFRSAIAGGFVGLLLSVFLLIASPSFRMGATLALPLLWGAVIGTGIGLIGVAVRRFILRGPSGPPV